MRKKHFRSLSHISPTKCKILNARFLKRLVAIQCVPFLTTDRDCRNNYYLESAFCRVSQNFEIQQSLTDWADASKAPTFKLVDFGLKFWKLFEACVETGLYACVLNSVHYTFVNTAHINQAFVNHSKGCTRPAPLPPVPLQLRFLVKSASTKTYSGLNGGTMGCASDA